MAIFHMNCKIISRGKGSSAVAGAAYQAGEKLYDEYYGEQQDYTRKKGVVESFIMLPDYAPRRLLDRQTLWNEVEAQEKRKDAQIAYSYDYAFQNELTLEENIRLLRKHLLKNYVSRGMICDVSIHFPDPEEGGDPNPHAHIKCPSRPLNKDGTWGLKQHKEEVLDENGKPKLNAKGKPMMRWVSNTDWGRKETLNLFRAEWARIVNEAFEEKGLDCRIDHRSYKEQGIDKVPQLHEGAKVRKMEKRGIRTRKGDWNRWVRETSNAIRKIIEQLRELTNWITEIKAELCKPQTPTIETMLVRYYDHRDEVAKSYGRGTRKAQLGNLKRLSELVTYIDQKGIRTGDDLEGLIRKKEAEVKLLTEGDPVKSRRLKSLQEKLNAIVDYEQYQFVYQKYTKTYFKGAKEKYKAEHKSEINRFQRAKRILGEEIKPEDFKAKRMELPLEIDSLKVECSVSADSKEVEELEAEIKALKDIQAAIIFCIGKPAPETDSRQREVSTTQERTEDGRARVSLKGKLAEKKEESKRLDEERQQDRQQRGQQRKRNTWDIS